MFTFILFVAQDLAFFLCKFKSFKQLSRCFMVVLLTGVFKLRQQINNDYKVLSVETRVFFFLTI